MSGWDKPWTPVEDVIQQALYTMGDPYGHYNPTSAEQNVADAKHIFDALTSAGYVLVPREAAQDALDCADAWYSENPASPAEHRLRTQMREALAVDAAFLPPIVMVEMARLEAAEEAAHKRLAALSDKPSGDIVRVIDGHGNVSGLMPRAEYEDALALGDHIRQQMSDLDVIWKRAEVEHRAGAPAGMVSLYVRIEVEHIKAGHEGDAQKCGYCLMAIPPCSQWDLS